MIQNKYFDQQKIDKTFPEAIMIPPMLINHIPQGKEDMLSEICEGGDYLGELKKDGAAYTFNKTEHYIYLFSRTASKTNGLLVNKIDNVPHIKEALSYLPPNTVLVGEIYYPGKTSKDVVTIMGCLPEEAVKRQEESEPIHYYIHDILCYNGVNLMDVGAEVRWKVLEKIIAEATKYPYIELAKIYKEDLEGVINRALAAGEEGVVLKRRDGIYTPGKRPAWVTLKVKKIDYADVILSGFCEPTKEYNGKELETWEYWINPTNDSLYPVGQHYLDSCLMPTDYVAVTKPYYLGWKTAIEISAYDENGQLQKIGTVSSGLTDELREDFAKNPDRYLGRVVAIQAMMKDNDAYTLRHPFFKGFRDDKNSSECRMKDIFS